MNLGAWLRVLARNKFAVPPRGLGMAALLSLFSVGNSALALAQQLLYGARIRRVELVAPPVFVIGHWRSGTTLLHELLAADPRHTCPTTYTCFGCNHFLLSESWLKPLIFTGLRPDRRPMDNMAIHWESPQEDEWALCNLGVRSPYLTCLFPNRPPQDDEYFDLQALTPAARKHWQDALLWYLRCLTLREPKRIILKTPLHTARIATLLELFPDARFIHIARDPRVLFPSTVHMWRRVYEYQGIQLARHEGLEERVLASLCRMYERFEADAPRVPAANLHCLRYEELVADPVGVLTEVYRRLDLGEFEPARPAVEAYAQRASRYQINRYQLTAETEAVLRERWRSYFQTYGYS